MGGSLVMVHRLVAILHGWVVSPATLVDHKDGNPSNNQKSNLRLSNYRVNNQNRCIHLNNSTGKSGVSWTTYGRGKATSAMASWTGANGQTTASFSVALYGLLPAFKMACDKRDSAVAALNSSGQNYTSRHGAVKSESARG